MALGAQAQFTLNWSTIDGGAGTGTGDVYSVSGTNLCFIEAVPAGNMFYRLHKP
jgi:hypothetical protein